MRAVLCGLVLTFAGCGRVAEPTTAPARPVEVAKADPVKPAERVAPKPKDDTVHDAVAADFVVNAFKDNRAAADGKYIGKRWQMKVRVDVIGRNKEGLATVGHETVVPFNKKVLPTAVFVFPKERDAQVAALKKGEEVTVVGRVTGAEFDGSNRGIQGYDFHLVVDDCEIKP